MVLPSWGKRVGISVDVFDLCGASSRHLFLAGHLADAGHHWPDIEPAANVGFVMVG